MSDVMKAINEAQSLKQQYEESISPNADPDTPSLEELCERLFVLNETQSDHIGELHKAIAELEDVCDGWPAIMPSEELDDLFDLLPTDWAGEGQ